MKRTLLSLTVFCAMNTGFSQSLLFNYTSLVDYDAEAYQYGQAQYLGTSFVGLKIISIKLEDETYNFSRFVILDLKGNPKWTWNAFSKGSQDFGVEASSTGSFWVESWNMGGPGSPPPPELWIYNRKTKNWLQSPLGQDVNCVKFLANGTANNSGLCTVTKTNEAGKLTFSVYRY